MSIVLDGSLGITTPDLASGPVAGTTANFSGALTGAAASFSGNVTLGSSVLATPSGSAPSYTCRAWVNFNGTTSPGTIRASGNVSSVTRTGTGVFTVNLSSAMPDANYVPVADTDSFAFNQSTGSDTLTTTSFRFVTGSGGIAHNFTFNYIAVFR
jgi:hypothetical protein